MIRRIKIKNLAIFSQRLKAMRTALGNHQHPPIIGVELFAMPLKKSRRTGAQIDRDIENLAAQTGDDLDLGVRRSLVVQSTHSPTSVGQTAVDLHDRLTARQRFQFTRTEQPLEPAALIDDRPALDDDDTVERGRLKTKTLFHS